MSSFEKLTSNTRRLIIPDEPIYDLSTFPNFLERIENKSRLSPSVALSTWTPSNQSLDFMADASSRFRSGRKRRLSEDNVFIPRKKIEEPFDLSAPPPIFREPQQQPPTMFSNEEDERKHFLYKFALLERLYPKEHIGNSLLRESMPLDRLKNDYIMLSKRFDMNEKMEFYMKGFIMFFMLLERFTGAEGLAQHHVENMSTYQRLLLKMDDKPMFKMFDNLSPEVMLMGTIALQTAVFWCNKRFFNGSDMLSKLGSMQLNMVDKAANKSK
jgi:hypothetical protein